jgi:phenylacetic acid degradation operon negative regulatory protein
VWISPHAERVGEVESVLAGAGLLDGAQVFVARHTGRGDLAAMVRQAWDLARIEAGYREFLAEFGTATGDPLARLVELVHAWRRFPAIDPELPTALLPPRWSGIRAAALFRRRHAAWSAAAAADWTSLAA